MARHVIFALVAALVAPASASAKGAVPHPPVVTKPAARPVITPVTAPAAGGTNGANGANKSVLHLAAPLRCDRLTITDGLPNANVRAIVQDRRGFVWFGTQDGLARYDGTKIRVYRPAENDPSSVSSGYITALTVDVSGKLWVGTAERGVNLYDPDTDRFTRFARGQGGLSSEGVAAITRDSKDRVWFAMSGGGLNRFEPATGTFTAFLTEPLDTAITTLDADTAGNLWLGTASEGVIRWTPDGGATVGYSPTGDEDRSAGPTPIKSILAASTGKVWIGTDGGGLYSLEPATRKFTRFRHDAADPGTISDDHVSVLFEDRNHTLWIGTPNGLDRMDSSGPLVRYQHDPNDPSNPTNLSFPAVEMIYQDSGGVMWVGGFTVGVCKFDEFRLKFGPYSTRTNALSFLEEPDGALWVGTYNGLYKYEWGAQRVTVYHDLGRNLGEDSPVALESVWITSMYRDHKGTLWIGLFQNGLVAFDPKTETYRRYMPAPDNPKALPVDTVFDIWGDDKGMLWLASWGAGLVRLDPERNEFTSFTADAGDNASGLSSNHLYKLYPDPTDKTILWIGTAKGGLVRFNTAAATATSFRHKDSDPNSLSGDDVVTMYREPSGAVWVGTYGAGLNRLDPSTGRAQRFTTGNSKLTNNTVFGILPDADGKLWLSTNGGGLLQLDPKTSTFLAYELSDGLQDNEFSQGAFLRSKSGKLFFGGAGGFNAFVPKDIGRDPYVPPIAVTAFKVFNQEVKLDQPIWTLPPIEVSYSESFELQFAALSFAAPVKNRYAYKLDGFDDRFIETDRPFATYTKLSGGNYTLRVRASNQHGVWNEAGIELKVHVTPPLWRTWPAYAVYVLLFAGAGYLVFLVQRQRLRRAEREGRLAVVERDLELTGAVQTGFLPENNEINTPRVNLFGFYRPADACGGDWWWHEELSAGRHVVMVGDVTGHGPGPAMVTAAVATAFRVLIEHGLDDVKHGLELLNKEVLRVAKGKYHMTMAALELDEATGRWIFHSAGAPPIFSLGQSGRHKVHFCVGTPLGTESAFEAGRVEGRLEKLDRILMYTDGIPEIALPGGSSMGMRRFAQQYERTRTQGLKDAAGEIVAYANQIQGNEPQLDDWTFTMIEWR